MVKVSEKRKKIGLRLKIINIKTQKPKGKKKHQETKSRFFELTNQMERQTQLQGAPEGQSYAQAPGPEAQRTLKPEHSRSGANCEGTATRLASQGA